MGLRLSIRQIAALLALVAVAAIFVLPAFDMPDTNLRAKALAQLITLVLVAMASTIAGAVSPLPVVVNRIARNDCSRQSDPSLTLTLPLLC
jgi:NhaP-type Na+/H+ or K+/H+ antiporter